MTEFNSPNQVYAEIISCGDSDLFSLHYNTTNIYIGRRVKVESEDERGFYTLAVLSPYLLRKRNYCLCNNCAHLSGGNWKRIGPPPSATPPSPTPPSPCCV